MEELLVQFVLYSNHVAVNTEGRVSCQPVLYSNFIKVGKITFYQAHLFLLLGYFYESKEYFTSCEEIKISCFEESLLLMTW